MPGESYLSRPQLYGGFGGYRGGGAAEYYGATTGGGKASPFFARGQRQRLNIVPVCQCLLLPWLLFCLVYAALSFEWHYTSPGLCWALVIVALLPVLVCGAMALANSWRKAARALLGGPPSDEAPRAPSWVTFLFVSSLAAWLLAVLLGNLNYATNLQPFYDYTNLNVYREVDPARMQGAQMMDAGRVSFTNNSVLDLRKSMGFKNLDTYCVAPITVKSKSTGEQLSLQSYDFWAVGLDCCQGNLADFHCDEFDNPSAHSGLRLLTDDQRPFYRLAVQQAEAAYAIKAQHPLFFYWSQDAVAEMDQFRDEGYKYFLIGMLVHFGWQIITVALAVAAFAKIGQHA